jgi:hypothetical protein
MAWLDAIKNAVYETPATPSAPAAPPSTASVGTVSAPAPTILGAPTVNVDMVAAIRKAVFGRNTAFTQLLTASEALADVIPDPTMRLKAAHKTGGAGRTGKQIADAVDVHLQDVDGEELRFKTMIDGKIQTEVGLIEQQAQQASAQATQASAEIEQLQQRIGGLQKLIGDLTTKAATASAEGATKRAELDGALGQFKLAANAVRMELNGSKSAILSTLV